MLDELLAEIQTEFPGFTIVKKPDSRLMRVLSWFLLVVTFGAQRRFMDKYVTTIGNTVYVPSDWDSWSPLSRVEVLRHERVHMRQQKKYGLVLFTFLYLVPFFPLFFAYGRARLEMEAYTESARAKAQLRGSQYVKTQEFRNWMASQFLTGAYGWMWIHKPTVLKWVDKAIADAVREFP